MQAVANIKSSKKRVRVNQARADRNKSRKSALKTAIKKAKASETPELVGDAIRKVDKAAARGLIHKNNAARKKSQLARMLNNG